MQFQYENNKLYYLQKTKLEEQFSTDYETEQREAPRWRLVIMSQAEQENILKQFHHSPIKGSCQNHKTIFFPNMNKTLLFFVKCYLFNNMYFLHITLKVHV